MNNETHGYLVRLMEEKLLAFQKQIEARYWELRSQFLDLAARDPILAMDRYGLELAETQECYALTRAATVRGLQEAIDYFELGLLRGDWQPRSSCPMRNALHQVRFLARCKLTKRFREMLNEQL